MVLTVVPIFYIVKYAFIFQTDALDVLHLRTSGGS